MGPALGSVPGCPPAGTAGTPRTGPRLAGRWGGRRTLRRRTRPAPPSRTGRGTVSTRRATAPAASRGGSQRLQPSRPVAAVRYELDHPGVVVEAIDPDQQVRLVELLDHALAPLDHGDR